MPPSLLGLILSLVFVSTSVVNAVVINSFNGVCNPCNVLHVLFPSSTEYLLQTGDKKVWYSSDEGQSWKLKLPDVVAMLQYETDPRTVVFSVGNGTMYGSTDGGRTLSNMSPPFIANAFSLHSSKPGWLLNYYCSETSCTLFYSKDLGNTWNAGPRGVAVRAALWGHDTNNPDLIFAILEDNTFAFTTTYGNDWTSLVPNCIGFALTDHFLYVGVAAAQGAARLYSSSSRLDPTHTLLQYYWLDEFPGGSSVPEGGYTFLDDSTRSEFVAVTKESTSWGRIYSSDFDGDQFTLSLDYVVSQQQYYDFAKFEGLKGMYIANTYTNGNATSKQTKFTFDNGGEWRLLRAPAWGYNSAPTHCDYSAGCSLHLHGQLSTISSNIAHFYSSPNAVGLMVANGNVGTSLSDDQSKTSTWLTRDAGVTWSQIFPEPTVFEFADHGGIFVFIPTINKTSDLYYSFDEGKNVIKASFSNFPVYVDNIFTEPTGTGRKFLMLAHIPGPINPENPIYYIFGLDFTDQGLRTCSDADYETWVPSNDDELNSQCFLGSVTTYQRRKQDSKCFNGRDTDHIISQSPCKCAWEDYECDVGFDASARNDTDGFNCTASINSTIPGCATGYRLIPDTMCQLSGGLDLAAKGCPGYSGTPYTTNTIGGSSDTSGMPTKIPTNAPGSTSTTGSKSKHGGKGGHGGLVAFAVILLVFVCGSVAVGVLYRKNEQFRAWVDKVKQQIPRGSQQQGYGRVIQDDI